MRATRGLPVLAAGALITLGLPLIAGKYYTELLSQALIFGIFAMSLDLMWGYAGVLNFGHAAYFGLGGYLVALLAREVRGFDPSYLGYALSVLAPAGLAGALGYFLFYSHVTGVYFTIITLVVTMIFQLIVSDWYWLGGMNGLLGVPGFVLRVWPGLGWELDSEVEVYYLLLSVSVLCYLFCRHVVRSPFGLVMAAIKDNPERTEFFGYDTAYLTTIMSMISAGLAGLSGALYAHFSGFVSPPLFGLNFSTDVIVWVAVGGRGTLVGAFVGAVLVNLLKAIISDFLEVLWLLIVGAFFIVTVFFFPDGIVGTLRKLRWPAPRSLPRAASMREGGV
ncbi:MAG: branched-chain amino acid ABC transporter permease [Candidatus Rokuibacteriota bacterium]|nr:MAG: branched-chain amino acid ABC transporter permease [Candidatus Rokubacteria bacterium]